MDISLVAIIFAGVQLLGVLNAAHAIMNVRSPQSATAWILGLCLFPWIVIPLYWVLGRRRFNGYEEAYQKIIKRYRAQADETYQKILAHTAAPPEAIAPLSALAKTLNRVSFLGGNRTDLLIDGDRTYNSIIEAIQTAQRYILFQFYIINDDEAGRRCLNALIESARQGVRIYVLYDRIGSSKMTTAYIKTCKAEGISIAAFRSTLGRNNRFQFNFRNHRKVVVIDGQVGFTGGLNIGDEYQGKDPKFGPWRDTHMRIEGPATKALQISFSKDWCWANGSFPAVDWESQPVGDETVLVLPTGPADYHQTCTLFVGSTIALAKKRVWIASPYFVPDEPTLAALKMAVLRGVDVRIILPKNPDHLMVYLCSFSYYTELKHTGIKLYRYRPGFMHQKIILIDDELAGVGTVNLDNRSFLLNFEIMAYVTKGDFVCQVERMLEDDLAKSERVDYSKYDQRPWLSRLAIQSARLVAPLQ
ncbi:MAG: cardiolipin synthase [Cyanobacteria bacterium P01_D01_bin.1]